MDRRALLQAVLRFARFVLEPVAPRGTPRREALFRLIKPFRQYLFAVRAVNSALSAPDFVYQPALRAEFLKSAGRSWPAPGPATEATAVYRLLDLLLDRPDLRARFPRALAEGPEGPFADWLQGPEAGVGADERPLLLAALERRPGLRLVHLFDQDEHLRRAHPLALAPAGRAAFAAGLIGQEGRYHVEPDAAVWFLCELAGWPTHGLAESFKRHASWQAAVPHGLTRFGWDDLKAWVARKYLCGRSPAWLASAVRPDDLSEREELHWACLARPDEALRRRLNEELRTAAPGVNLLGHVRYPSGLQVAAANTRSALELAGYHVSVRDVPCGIECDLPGRDACVGLHPHPVTISQLAPEPLAEDCYERAGLAMRPDTYRIGYWYWELEEAPASWARHASWLHELWAPTRFIAEALRRCVPLPVFDMLPGMSMPEEVELPRASFGLPEGRFLFLFVFDMASTAQRKNPDAVLAAYRRAFGAADGPVLALKVSRGWHDPEALARLREASDGRRVFLLDEVMPYRRLTGLINCCDAYVSLHRSEGFGLTMAEAMALGKPVIATRYSGNLDFMSDDNSLLVGYRRTTLERGAFPYPEGCVWAEPDVEQAAAHMRRLAAAPELCRYLGERARREVRQVLSLEAAGRRMAGRLREIAAAGGRKAA